MAHAAGQHWNMIDVSIRHHSLQSIFRITRGEFVFDMLIPKIRQGLLRVDLAAASKIPYEKLQRPEMSEFRRPRVVMLAAGSAESVILFCIIINRRVRIRIQAGM